MSTDEIKKKQVIIEGHVDGDVVSEYLLIAEKGNLHGKIRVSAAEIYGSFDGDLVVDDTLIIHESGKVTGTVSYKKVEIKSGGQLNAKIVGPNLGFAKVVGDHGQR